MADRCERCNAAIVFVRTARGHTAPVDPEQIPIVELQRDSGRPVVAGYDPAGKVQRGHAAGPDERPFATVRVSHFATCPSADYFRRRRS